MNTVLQRPVSGKDFFDREVLLDEMMKGDHHIALVGPRKAGKTSIFQQFLQLQTRAIAAYYYIPFEITVDYFCYGYFVAVATAYLKDQGAYRAPQAATPHSEFMELSRDLMSLRPDIAGYLSDLQTEDMQTRNTGALRGILQGFMDLPYRLQTDATKDIILILDEFQNVSVLQDLVPDVLREKILHKQHVYYYLAGSEIGIMHDMLNEYSTPLFGHLTQHRVEEFSVADARQFVLYLLREEKLLVSEHVLNAMVSITGGFPYYLRVLIREMTSIAREKGAESLEKDDIVTALQRSLFGKTGPLSIYFVETLEMNLRRKRSGRYYQLLQTLAQRGYTLSDLARETGMAVTSIPTYLQDLLRMELIAQYDGLYHVKDTLMRFWLRAVYAHAEDIQMSQEEKQAVFTQRAYEILDAYKSELGIAREAQIRELFILSGQYRHVSGGYLEGQEFDIIADGEDGFVLGEIKTRNITEGDVERFRKKVSRVGSVTVQERILVSLMGMEERAETWARKHGVEVWTVQKVNRLRKKYRLAPIRL